jgi:hypothetical protein
MLPAETIPTAEHLAVLAPMAEAVHHPMLQYAHSLSRGTGMLAGILALALGLPQPSSGPRVPPVATAIAPIPSTSGQLDSIKEALNAFSAHSQTLSSLALLLIGGSLLILLQRGYLRPPTRRGRAFYLLFILGWGFLAISVWHGRRAQSVYLSYLMARHPDVKALITAVNYDLSRQIDFLQRGLITFALWLLGYLLWWIFSSPNTSEDRPSLPPRSAPTRPSSKPSVGALLISIFFVPLTAKAASRCDCPHPPWQPEPPCVARCASLALNASSAAELTLLQIDAKTANALAARIQLTPIESLSQLPADQRELLESAVHNAQLLVLTYLASSPTEKERFAHDVMNQHPEIYQAWLTTRHPIIIELRNSLTAEASEALARAKEGGKLAEGKFLYQVELKLAPRLFGFSPISTDEEAALNELAQNIRSTGPNFYLELQSGDWHAEAVRTYLHNIAGLPLDRIGIRVTQRSPLGAISHEEKNALTLVVMKDQQR